MGPLGGKIALVTGASRGIGLAIAKRLSQDGAGVVVNYSASAGRAQEAVAAIASAGGQALAVEADLSRIADVRLLFRKAEEWNGHLDIVVANAGIFAAGLLADVTEDDFERIMAVNARGTFYSLQEAARRVSDGGRIINVSSAATIMSFPGAAVYCASKAAGEQFTRSLARELGVRGITANIVSPGFTDTAMLPADAAYRENARRMSPLGRLGRPEDIAGVVAFLAGPEAAWITGQNIQVGGGIA